MSELAEEQKKQAIWCAHTLFVLGKTSGSSGNISFRIGEHVYISAGNTCFGTLSEDDFSVITMQNTYLAGKKPSKESPMHLAFYKAHPDMQAVIHTHGRYAVLWSCVPRLKEDNCIPAYTPYLNMKLGTVGLIPYASPGTEKLFQEFESHMGESRGYLLKQHGAIVAGKDIMDAFYGLEELEEGAKIAWELMHAGLKDIPVTE